MRTGSGRSARSTPMSIARSSGSLSPTRCAVPGARHGAALDGNPGNGKTTIVSHFGRHYERRCRQRYPARADRGWARVSAGRLCQRRRATDDQRPQPRDPDVLRDGPATARPTPASSRSWCSSAPRLCQTSLIVIDDIHLLELRREADRDANNHLKRFANDLQATFVYAGVGLSHGGFMHEGRYGAGRGAGADQPTVQAPPGRAVAPLHPDRASDLARRAVGVRARARAAAEPSMGI